MNDIVYAGKHLITYSVQSHQHLNWELVYCTSGSGEFVFENGESPLPYQAGDLVIIPPGLEHANYGEKGFTNIHLNMNDSVLSFRQATLVHDDASEHIHAAFRDAFYFYYAALENRELVLNALGSLIISYITTFPKNRQSVSRPVAIITAGIVQNFQDCSFELDEFLKSLPFNDNYLRKLFKSEMGITPRGYLENIRLETAASFLLLGHGNVSEIAQSCGYEDPLYFSRVFKKRYGCSPSHYADSSSKARV